MHSQTRQFSVLEACAGERLDRVLAEALPEYSRSRLQSWIRDGQVTVGGQTKRPRDPLASRDCVVVTIQEEIVVHITAEPITLDVVYQDDDIIVINKPAGLVVHPGAGNAGGTLQNALLHLAPELAQVPRAGLVHRLDKDTTGLLIVARNLIAHTALVAAMQRREIHREYEAVVCGLMTAGGHVEALIGRHPRDRKRMAVLQSGGRESVTHYRLISRFRAHCHLRLKLETGRTHQIRVHMQHIRHPIVGDPVYGRRPLLPPEPTEALQACLQGFHRQALHARRLALKHPLSGEKMDWELPLPEDMQQLLAALREDAAVQRG